MKEITKKLKLRERKSKPAGLPPGTLVYVGEKKIEAVKITYMDYDEQNFAEKQVSNIDECFPFKTTPSITWINIDGLHEVRIIEKLGQHFELHPLVLEDILHAEQRPKFDDYGNYIFIVLKMFTYNEEKQTTEAEQISLVLGPNFVLSFQETVGDIFDRIRDRIRNGTGRIRKMGGDYLVYSLIDAIVDNYFTILEKIGEKIEALEKEIISDPKEQTLQQIHAIRREMVFLRRSVWPLRELINNLQRSESPLIQKPTGVYLRDVYDHTIQIIDMIESCRDMVSVMLENYLTSISNKLNSIMKVLTIIATIFMPLTFISGVYGMNFKYMPELQSPWGYPAVLAVMAVIAVAMLFYFRKKKWL